ncbi:unnamed protein product [Peronospora effusa]|nr:unnamed protein product [Peronospora effusa]
MRVHIQLLLAAAAVTHAIKAEPTTFVGVSKSNSSAESSSTAARDKGDGMTNVNVLVKEVLAEEKTRRTIATSSPTKPSEESINTAGRDDGERMFARLSEMVEKAKGALHSKVGNVVAKTDISQAEAHEMFLEVVKKNYGKQIFKKLLKKFNDKQIAQIIEHAKTKKFYITILSPLEGFLMDYWKKQKKSAHDVFELLGLAEAKDDLFGHPLFHYWSTYVKKLNTEKSKKKLSVVDVLMSEYKNNDAALARLVVAAKMGPRPNDAVLELENAQMEYWLNQEKQSAHDVFKLLGLDEAKNDLFDHPLFHYWSTYVKMFNNEPSQEKMSVVDVLTPEYYSDGDLARLIVAAKKGPRPNDAVLELENAQMEYWLKKKKQSAHDVFNLLGLTKAKNDLLDHPLFHYWSTYVKMFNNEPFQEKMSVVDVLTPEYYSDGDLARLIVAAKKGPRPNDAVLELEKVQMEYWLKKKKQSAHDVFNLLGLTKAKNDLFDHPLFHYWSTYVERFNNKPFKEKMSVFGILMSEYKNNDAALARLIVNAKKNKKNKEINKSVVALGEEQLKYWLSKGLSVDEVFELLRLHTVEDGVLTNPVFNQWYSYFEMVNKKHGNKESVIDFLSSKKGTSFEDFMKDELEKANLETKSRVDELFVDLRLERVGDGLFTDPLFIFWRACLEKFNAAHPKNPRTSVIQSLRTVYGDKGLVDLINAERKVTDSVKYASRLEEDLCATWLSDGKSLDDVFELLDLNRAGYKLLEDPSMKTFARFTQVASMDSKELPKTKEASFEENEILRGIKIASSTGELESTDSEIALLRLWFTQKKDPKEVYKMYFGKHNMRRILKKKGNLFEIPLFITFVKYSEGYSRTKRLATDDEAIETNEDKLCGTDPTYMVKCVDREFSMPLLLQDQFADKMDKLGEMIMSVKESSSNSVKASSSKPMKESSSKSTLFAVKRVEVALFHFWNRYVLLNDVFKKLQLNTEMTPAELFGNPSFRWWIDYADYLLLNMRPVLIQNARLEENTKEFADRVWSNLLKEHLQANTNPKIIKTELMIPPKSFHDEKDVKEYKHLYDRKINDAREKMKGDVKAWKTNTKLREAKRKKLEEEELKKMEQEMKTKREED